MTPIVEQYADVRFDPERFTCWEFARRVRLDNGGSDIGERRPDTSDRRAWFKTIQAQRVDFRQIDRPVPLCLVLLERRGAAHVGVWIRGAMAHLFEDGPRHEPVRRAMMRLGYLKASYHVPA